MAPPSDVYVPEIPRERFTSDSRPKWAHEHEANISQESIPVTEKPESSTGSLDIPKTIGIISSAIGHTKDTDPLATRGVQVAKEVAQEVLTAKLNSKLKSLQASHSAPEKHDQGSRSASQSNAHNQRPESVTDHAAPDVFAQNSLRDTSASPPHPRPASQHRRRSSSYRRPSVHNESSELDPKHNYEQRRTSGSSATTGTELSKSTVKAQSKLTKTQRERDDSGGPGDSGNSGEKLAPAPDHSKRDQSNNTRNEDTRFWGLEAPSPTNSTFESIWEPHGSSQPHPPSHAPDTRRVTDDSAS